MWTQSPPFSLPKSPMFAQGCEARAPRQKKQKKRKIASGPSRLSSLSSGAMQAGPTRARLYGPVVSPAQYLFYRILYHT